MAFLGAAGAMEGLRRLPFSMPEVRLALRVTARHPVLSISAVAALTVAIGLATSLFTVASGVVWATLPFPAGDRFVDLDFRTVENRYSVPPPLAGYEALRDRASTLEGVGAYRSAQLTLAQEGTDPRAVSVAYVTPSSFAHFAVPPTQGRVLVPADAESGTEGVVVIRADLWESHWGGDPAVVGRTVLIGGRTRTIVGIMPPGFGFPVQSEAWIPLDEATLGGSLEGAHPRVQAYGVLAAGTDIRVAEQQLQSLLDRTRGAGDPLILTLRKFTQAGTGNSGHLLVLVVALLLILALVASNVANLILTRTMGRWSELSVRSALGARRSRLVWQIATEVLILVGLAAGLGLLASRYAMGWLLETVDDFPFWVDLSPNWRVGAFMVLVGALASVIAGVLPALRATSGTGSARLHGNQSAANGLRLGRFSASLVLVQVSLCVTLISGALVLGKALRGYATRNPAVAGNEILTTRVYFDPPVASGGAWVVETSQLDSIRGIYRRVTEAIQAVPAIESVAFTTELPGSEAGLRPIQVEGLTEAGDVEVVSHASVSPGFFETLDIELLAGRSFVESETLELVVNQPFVERVLLGRNAVGQRVRFAGDPEAPWYQIVGVVPDLDMSPADPEHRAGVYRTIDVANLFYGVVRPRPGLTDRVGTEMVVAATDVIPEVRVDEIMPLHQAAWAPRALLGALLAGFGGVGMVSLLLSLIGLYAIMSHSVARRSGEIGIRRALGAPRVSVLRLILGRAVLQVGAGAGLGLLLTVGLVRGMRVLPIRIGEAGFWPVAVTVTLMLLAGAAAAWVPARRALDVSPLEALRSR